jgi:hypothetical protein
MKWADTACFPAPGLIILYFSQRVHPASVLNSSKAQNCIGSAPTAQNIIIAAKMRVSAMNSELLFSMWARLGVNFPAFDPSKEEPPVEELIAQTSLIGRYEPRLIEGMAGWLQKHGDLINASLMRRHIQNGDPAVIGLIFDTLSSKETAKLKQPIKYCRPKKKPEMLFYPAETSPTMKAQAVENETELNLKWNLFYVSLRVKTDSVFERKEVLKRNSNLARRALFGVVMRTEIWIFLLQKRTSFPAEISIVLGYRYHRVIADIQCLIRDGAIIDSFAGKRRQLKISPSFHEYLNTISY